MKKLLPLILILIMLFPLNVNGETCNNDKIIIESITSGDKTDNVKERIKTTVKDNKINLYLSMSEPGDSIEYELTIKNDSNEDYEINNPNTNNDYINYSFKTEDKTNIVKAHSTKSVVLSIVYKNEFPDNYFKNGEYTDNRIINLNFTNKQNINPKTSVQFYIILIMFVTIISLIIFIMLKKRKYTKYLILILLSFTIIIPIMVNALCKSEIIIESDIQIDKKYNVYIRRYGYIPENELDNYYINLYSMKNVFDDNECSDNYVIYENQKYYDCHFYDKIASYHYKEYVDLSSDSYNYDEIDLTDCENNICNTMNITHRTYHGKTIAYPVNANPYYQEDDWEIMSEGIDYGWSQLNEEGSPPLVAFVDFIMPMHDVFLTDTWSFSGISGVRPLY